MQEPPGCMHPLPAHRPIELTFSNLTVTLDDKRHVLKNISGVVKPGQVLAVMGPSGESDTALQSFSIPSFDILMIHVSYI